MAFGGFILTNVGRNLLAKIQSGEIQGLNFTKFSIGDGTAPASITNMNALVNEKKVVQLKNKIGKDGITTLEGSFSNEDITTGFFFKEWGIYASNGQTEILYAYDNAGADAEYIAQKGAVLYEKMLKAALIISSDISVTINTSGTLYLETVGDLKDTISTFIEATKEADIVTGEKSSTIFGKLLKSIKTFRTAIATNVQNILLNATAIDTANANITTVSQQMEQKADKYTKLNAVDINTIHIPNTYGVNNCTNVPYSTGYLIVLGFDKDNKWGSQILITDQNPSKMYFRASTSGTADTWTPWSNLSTTDKIDILLTANTNFTILRQNCFEMNGMVYIDCCVQKNSNVSTTYESFAKTPILPPSNLQRYLLLASNENPNFDLLSAVINGDSGNMLIHANATGITTFNVSGIYRKRG